MRVIEDVCVVDLRLGNVGSVCNPLSTLGVSWTRSSIPIPGHKTYILPGVGSFDEGMRRLRDSGWADLLLLLSDSQKVIGLCLGMQMMCEGSDEGLTPGLGLLPGRFRRFAFDRDLERAKIPHMGWNLVEPTASAPTWFKEAVIGSRFYFVHSYHYVEVNSCALGLTDYGYKFSSVIGHKNLFGAQFHPEKSHRFGAQLMRRLLSERNFF